MKRITFFLVVLLISTSCSSLKKSLVYGGLAGAAIGGTAGAALSPDKYSRTGNSMVFGGLGALLGAGLGYFFFKDDPENRDLPTMLYKEEAPKTINGVSSATITPVKSSVYRVGNMNLPENLKQKLENPSVVEHEIPERTEKLEGGRSVIIQSHKAWEVSFEDLR